MSVEDELEPMDEPIQLFESEGKQFVEEDVQQDESNLTSDENSHDVNDNLEIDEETDTDIESVEY